MIATAPLWLCWMVPVAIFGGMDANPSLFIYDWMKRSSNSRSTYFKNKRIWITGASSGIGAELARQFHQHGAHLILSSRKEESLLQLQTSLQQHDDDDNNECQTNSIQILPLDVTMSQDDDDGWNDIFQNVNVDDIDIVILNAGLGQLSPAEQDLSMEKQNRQIMEVNYWGPVQMTQRLLQQQSKKKNLHIVVTSSVAAKMAVPLSSTYAASKHALHGYFKSLQSEVAADQHTIRIDLPCPGPVDTNFHQNILQPNRNNDLTTTTTGTKSTSKSKMPPQRCAQLIIASIMGPSILMHETWISRQPTLFFTYLSQYSPGLATLLLNQIGKLRLRAHKSGLPLYELSTWLKVAFQYKQLSESNNESEENKS